jgi:hypothetical protein
VATHEVPYRTAAPIAHAGPTQPCRCSCGAVTGGRYPAALASGDNLDAVASDSLVQFC